MNVIRIRPTAWILYLCAAVVVTTCMLFGQGIGISGSSGDASNDAVTEAGGSSNATPTSNIRKIAADFKKTWKPLEGEDRTHWIDAFLTAAPTSSSTGTIAQENAQAYTNGTDILVRAAVTGKGLVEPSGISIVFTAATGQKSSTVETVFLQGNGGGSVKTWIDGKNVLDTFVADPTKPGTSQTVGWNEFTSCLNNAGVAAWVVTAITIACSAICIGTAGAGCVPCIAAAAGVTGGVFYSCAARALFYS